MLTREQARSEAIATNKARQCPQFPHPRWETKVEVRNWSRDGKGESWHCRDCGTRIF